MREPIISGVAGGVGARTLAVALGASAVPPGRHQPCDVLVCRATVHSVHLAERHVAAVPGAPVLAVLTDRAAPRSVRAKLRMLAAHVEQVVRLPWVPRWTELADPYRDASRLAFRPLEEVPKPLRDYRNALTPLVQAVRPLVAAPPPGLHPPTAHPSTAPTGAAATTGGAS